MSFLDLARNGRPSVSRRPVPRQERARGWARCRWRVAEAALILHGSIPATAKTTLLLTESTVDSYSYAERINEIIHGADPVTLLLEAGLALLAMQSIIHGGPISRASISKQTGLSKQTVSELVRILEEDGWVRETAEPRALSGRTATLTNLFRTAHSWPRSTSVAPSFASRSSIWPDLSFPRLSLRHIRRRFGCCRTDRWNWSWRRPSQGQVERKKVRQTVVGCPGVPDQVTGAVRFAPNIAGIDGLDFRAAVSDATGTQVLLETTRQLAVLASSGLVRGMGVDHLAFIALGTGIGRG